MKNNPEYIPDSNLQKEVDDVFKEHFGYTPFGERMKDIQNEFFELVKWDSVANIKEEAGDLMASLIKLCAESEWDYRELVQNSLEKIKRRKLQYQALGRKTKIAILGGAFDPITNGHIQTAKFVLDTSGEFDEVWIMPAYNHMSGKEMVDAETRLAMCELAAKVDGRIKVFDYEINHKLAGETFNFFKRLKEDEQYKDTHNFSMIIGMDNALSFDKWVNFEELERMVRFVVVPRKGFKPDITGIKDFYWFNKQPHIYLRGEKEPSEISSTLIRIAASEGEDSILKKGLNQDVYSYIKYHQLYGYMEK